MDVKYWNDFAHKYDEQVTDALTYGLSNTLANVIERFASTEHDAADFGCGPGKLLPLLAAKFRKIYGYDFSDKLLNIARQRCDGLKNVVIENVDLSQAIDHLPLVDAAFSFNAAIMPDTDLRL
ncbi:MAG: methyltransferase domain-containing protein, partial [Chloroflexi bacterium]|nr:methyltransferase domain-containing protein [Chloroflexota bacterium]